MLCKEFITMFAPHDHLPLDRIITRFSSPTTITQFQRSSLDGILIELARLVPHGANDNIFCLSGPAKSAGGEGGRAPHPRRGGSASFDTHLPASCFATMERDQCGPSEPVTTVKHTESLFRASARVIRGLKRVRLEGDPNTSREQTPTSTLVF